MKDVTIQLSQFADGGICVSASDGEKAYVAVKTEFEQGNRIELSFTDVARLTTAFLNSAIGRLYREFPRAQLRKQFAPPVNAEPWHLNCLKRTIDRALIDPGPAQAAMQSEAEPD
jgi:hypothetical protein